MNSGKLYGEQAYVMETVLQTLIYNGKLYGKQLYVMENSMANSHNIVDNYM